MARSGLADAKAATGIYRGYSDAERRKAVTRQRRELTRQAFFQRVEHGEPLACLRWRWMQDAEAFRGKIPALQSRVQQTVEEVEADRKRVAAGVITKGRTKGKPYSAVTLRNLRRGIERRERELAEAEAKDHRVPGERTAALSRVAPRASGGAALLACRPREGGCRPGTAGPDAGTRRGSHPAVSASIRGGMEHLGGAAE